ncbi:MAG TPA: YncE family protein [Rudaea sp.]|jgi:YVTN family beta-propeller protein
MKPILASALLSATLSGFGVQPIAAGETNALLQSVADIPLGGNTTRLDYASFDADRHLLFIAHLGDSAVIVFDTKAQRVVSRIASVRSVHGVLAIPALGKVYASATGSNEVVAIDETTLQITARVPGGIYPDGMAYAPDVHKLYVSDEHGNTDTVIDVNANKRVATIPLGGNVGNTQYDPQSKHIFANVQTQAQLVEIDPVTDKIVDRIALPGAKGNHGLLIEPELHRAFIACEDNDKLLVLDLGTKKIIAAIDVGKDPDVLAFDPESHRLYVAGEGGVVSVIRTERSGVEKIGESHVGPNAHVVAVDPTTHYVYFPLMKLEGHTALRIMRATP